VKRSKRRAGWDRAAQAKLKAGFCLVTGIYFAAFLLYSGIVLAYLGADGFNLAVQADHSGWKCFYHITVWQKYLLIAAGGYIGCLFLSFFVYAGIGSGQIGDGGDAALRADLPFLLPGKYSRLCDTESHRASAGSAAEDGCTLYAADSPFVAPDLPGISA